MIILKIIEIEKGLYTYYTKLYLKINLFTKVDLRRSVKILG